MYVHNYDARTGEYTTSQLASPDPLDANNWLIPAFATNVTPPERPRGQWPFFDPAIGAWTLRADWRSIVLYRTDNGELTEIFAVGVTPEEVGLTTDPRPTEDHVFKDGAWQLDDAKVLARRRAGFMEQVDIRMKRAQQENYGKGDALTLGLLTPLEAAMYRAWSEYQMALVRLTQNADFTREIQWPDLPDADAVRAAVDAEEADKQRLKDEEAARAAALAAQEEERAAAIARNDALVAEQEAAKAAEQAAKE
jgi:hypothetical protein